MHWCAEQFESLPTWRSHKVLHLHLVTGWDAFALADKNLRGAVDVMNDTSATDKLVTVERSEGRKSRYYVRR